MSQEKKRVRIKWVKSGIGAKENHKATIKALGLRRLHHEVEKELTPSIQGMINTVNYLVKVEVID